MVIHLGINHCLASLNSVILPFTLTTVILVSCLYFANIAISKSNYMIKEKPPKKTKIKLEDTLIRT